VGHQLDCPNSRAVIAVEERRRRVERSLVLPQPQAHADLVDPFAFEQFLVIAAGLRFDVMLEARRRHVALLRVREQLTGATAAPARAVAAGIPLAPMPR
jgi:hypothetical protein